MAGNILEEIRFPRGVPSRSVYQRTDPRSVDPVAKILDYKISAVRVEVVLVYEVMEPCEQ